jgi:hypothetical protein
VLKPDASTYFPLLPGSFWHYEGRSMGVVDKGSGETDSVVSLTETGSGYRAMVIRKYDSDDAIDTILYVSDTAGMVYNEIKGRLIPFAKLLPVVDDTVGDCHYRTFNRNYGVKREEDLFELVKNEYDTYTGGREIEWQSFFFKKGVGIVSKAAAGYAHDLLKHRIGK